ncbi:PAS domain-containing protein [Lichenihabitans sp. Uapishka_5]|uniref:PAS domain-containing protein n=1 Tax=Lichenihabitans sp. Uapishka_5 TaxID=3037302 RepID=UPI0029E7F6CC|nr:PAS domain-containing protein [Lichenihabitans sp. Uapishka_5]MDX7949702.1 PAS domain-containing protein [Lichenihabitans sp. Uapishka_5]
MKLATSQAVFEYWHSLCRGRVAPDRHDLDPAAMRGMLAHTFMLEVHGPASERRFTIRLSGTRLDALFRREMKGADFDDLWSDDAAPEMRTLLDGVLDDTQPMLFGVSGAPAGDTVTAFELLVLPLRHHGRTQARLLCSLVPAGTPSWIGLLPLAPLSLAGWRALDARAESAAMQHAAPMRFTGGIRRAHLVVYEGGRNGDVTAAPKQVRVKTGMPRSSEPPLSTRRS